jgi:ATPase subunit of ABC transporter with duplicated ATPase domains
VLHVKQEAAASSLSVLEYVLNADTERTALLAEEARLTASAPEEQEAKNKVLSSSAPEYTVATTKRSLMTEAAFTAAAAAAAEADKSEPLTDKQAGDRLNAVYERLQEIEADTAPDRVRALLVGLGFKPKQLSGRVAALSGGWRMRVSLCTALFLQPDILLLDEPTNHLDLKAAHWLQGFVQDYPNTVCVVSHDRAFLNAVCTNIIHFHRKALHYYPGNYDDFHKTREDKQKKVGAQQAAMDRKRQHMEKSIRNMEKSSASKRKRNGKVKKGDEKKQGLIAARRKKLGRFGLEKTEDG